MFISFHFCILTSLLKDIPYSPPRSYKLYIDYYYCSRFPDEDTDLIVEQGHERQGEPGGERAEQEDEATAHEGLLGAGDAPHRSHWVACVARRRAGGSVAAAVDTRQSRPARPGGDPCPS